MMDISGATVYRGILGYGAKGHTHKQNLLHTGRDLPVMIAVVETEQKLSLAAEAVEEMLQDGLIVVSDVDIVRLIHPHSLLKQSRRLPMQNYQPAKLLRLHFTERDRYHGKPLYEAIV